MTDLTPEEQTHTRRALRYLRTRCGGWELLGGAVHLTAKTLSHVSDGRAPSALLALRLARLARVPVDDVLGGRYPPPGACPHCGHIPDKPA